MLRTARICTIAIAAGLGAASFAAAQAATQDVPPVPTELAQPVVEAEAAIVKSDWKTAEGKLAPYLIAHPNDGRALFDAGYVADAENRLDDAAGFYRRAIEANQRSFEASLSLGLLLARQDKPEEARDALLEATKLDPGEAGPALKGRAWRALAEIDASDDPELASNELLEALKVSPETPADTLLAAQLAEAADLPDQAEAAYRRVLVQDAKSAPAQAGLAHLLIAQKKYPEAATLLRAALKDAPDDPALNAQLAAVLVAQDDADALPLLEKLHGAHPRDANLTRMLAEVKAQAGDMAGSDRLYVELLAGSPDDADLLVAHGQNLTRQMKYAEAMATYDKASRLDPTNGDAWSGLAFAAFKSNRADLTLHALTERSKVLAEVPSTYFLWATAYDTLHDKANATAYYHRFLDSAAGKYPDQEWQAKQRLALLEKKSSPSR